MRDSILNPIVCLSILCSIHAGVADVSAQDDDDARRPIELKPYRVEFSVVWGCSPEFTIEFREQVFREIGDSSRRILGQMWDVKLAENKWLLPRNRSGLDRLSTRQLNETQKEGTADKVFLVVVDSVDGTIQISGREWDRSTQTVGPSAQRRIYERRAVGPEVFSLARQLFHPISEIDEADGKDVVVRVRAGEFLSADPDAAQFRQEDLLQPYMRYLDRELILQQVQMMPWSYLVVQKINRGRIECHLKSGMRDPLGGKSRRRVEVRAVSLKRITDSTRLKLVPNSNVSQTLSGYRVSIAPKHPSEIAQAAKKSGDGNAKDADEKQAKPKDDLAVEYIRLLSDRSGRVRIGVDNENSIVWLYIRSGKNLLAILPFAPGISTEDVLKLPDDMLRLDVEGSLSLLEAELIDTVARRAMLMAVATSQSRKEQWDKVDDIFKQLDELPKAKFFETKLTAIRFPATKAAEERKDRRAQGKINKLCNQMRDSIRQHLDPTQPKELKVELDELRTLDKQDQKQGKAESG